MVIYLGSFMAPQNPYNTAVVVEGASGAGGFAFEDVTAPRISRIELGAFNATADGFQLDFDNLTVGMR